MKKLVVLVLMLSLVLMVVGCGQQETVEEQKTVQEEMTTTQQDCVTAAAIDCTAAAADCTAAPDTETEK